MALDSRALWAAPNIGTSGPEKGKRVEPTQSDNPAAAPSYSPAASLAFQGHAMAKAN